MGYQRVVLKLSGEFMGGDMPLSPERLKSICTSIELLTSSGTEVCVVAGGGNIFRGIDFDEYGIGQREADEVGMAATGVNAMMLERMLIARQLVFPKLLANGPCSGMGPRWTPQRALDLLASGHTPIVAGGLGQPFISTDYPSVAFAAAIGADAVLMAKFGTDGVYDSDPAQFESAAFIGDLTVSEALERGVKVMDSLALVYARDHSINIHVFSADEPGFPAAVVKGENVGSIVRPL